MVTESAYLVSGLTKLVTVSSDFVNGLANRYSIYLFCFVYGLALPTYFVNGLAESVTVSTDFVSGWTVNGLAKSIKESTLLMGWPIR